VTVEGVTMTFGSRRVLDGVDAHLPAGELSALMGPSGAGKSTLLAIIAGHLVPTTGTVRVTDSAGRATSQVEWMVQSTPTLPRRTAWDNAALGALARGLDRPLARDEAARVLEMLSLTAVRDTRAFRLSGGERQRVAVARSIARRTPVLLADEPTASLDPESRAAVCHALRVAADAGVTVAVATHDPWVADRCDRVVPLLHDQGR
jgi:ABC-type multidrug transport system ATPase subunit